MEVKKARRADLEKGKSRWLFMGLIVTLSFMFVSFEWTERNVTYAISDLVSDPDFFEELVPVTYNQDKPLPPPPPPAAVNPEELNIVDNNSTETETDIAASSPPPARFWIRSRAAWRSGPTLSGPIRRPATGTARLGTAKREALAAGLAGYLEGAGCSSLLDSPDGDAVEGLSVDLEALDGL